MLLLIIQLSVINYHVLHNAVRQQTQQIPTHQCSSIRHVSEGLSCGRSVWVFLRSVCQGTIVGRCMHVISAVWWTIKTSQRQPLQPPYTASWLVDKR